ncbi:LacI family DNA-binding transcriptional regulator [Lacrimispora indolis]|uniref:LacI family DNA-binding transcriptional regulator n=1 Tax=Lacrimispora indolis TaxID=69825 RepID=UPI00041AF44A|nr:MULTISPECIES: LacI family DNA-binding transcriptional regulator [Lachnospiraceae]MBE7719203.1 LacI family transcriptional regulator [Lacrimispora celerecrescens]
MATIYDVSRESGFSVSTVSKVINNYKGVNKETSALVKQTIKELGFVPNNTARTLATQKSWLIGIVFAEEQGMGIMHPHYSGILQGFKMVAGGYGYDIVFINNFLGEKKISFLEHCKYRNVDGVLLALNNSFLEQFKDLLDAPLPKVSVEGIFPGVPSVISDNAMAANQSLKHLYMLGHRKIAILAGPQDTVSGSERFKEYRRFIRENNLEWNPKYCVEASKYSREAGLEAVNILFQQCWDEFPTAIYATYDEYASGAIEILRKRGFRIPEDVSVIGNDDLPVASYVSPGITTIRQDREQIGAQAARLLVEIMEKKTGSTETIRIPTKLIVRESTFRMP